MQPIWANLAALAVAVIYYAWRAHQQTRLRRRLLLRERVAYLLWVTADHAEQPRDTLRDIAAAN
jgi:hypothetical protein